MPGNGTRSGRRKPGKRTAMAVHRQRKRNGPWEEEEEEEEEEGDEEGSQHLCSDDLQVHLVSEG